MEMLGSLFAPAVPGGLLTGSSGEDHCDPGIHHVSKGTVRGQRAQMTCHLSKLVQACVLGEVRCGYFASRRSMRVVPAGRGSGWSHPTFSSASPSSISTVSRWVSVRGVRRRSSKRLIFAIMTWASVMGLPPRLEQGQSAPLGPAAADHAP